MLTSRRIHTPTDPGEGRRRASPLPPNHHADQRQFGGPIGYVTGFVMTIGRGREARHLCELALDGTEQHVVDLGCGPGTAVRVAAGRVPQVSGVDPARSLLRVGRFISRVRPATGHIDWVRAGAESLPFADGSVSLCWSVASVHHWPDLDRGVREVRRVLVPGGRFVVAESCSKPGARGPGSHGWTPGQVELFIDLLDSVGFSDIVATVETIGRHRAHVVEGRVQ